MQLGIRLHDTEKLPIEKRLALVRKQGFSCAHIALSKTFSDISTAPSALTPGFACFLRREFEKNELDIAVLGCYLNLANPDSTEMTKIYEKYKSHALFASLLGCGVLGTETGAPNQEYKYVPACHTNKCLELFIKRLAPVIEYCEKLGVVFAIEPVFKHIVSTPKRAKYVLESIKSPNLKIIFDPVNLLDISNYNERESIFAEAIELLGNDIAVLHLKDFIVRDGGLVSVAAGGGEMNYKQILSFIKSEKPYIHATLENTVPENAERSRAFIQRVYNEL